MDLLPKKLLEKIDRSLSRTEAACEDLAEIKPLLERIATATEAIAYNAGINLEKETPPHDRLHLRAAH